MDGRLFIDDSTALDVVRRLRAAAKTDYLHTTRITAPSGCVYKSRDVMAALESLNSDIRSLLRPDLGTPACPIHICVSQDADRSRASGVIPHIYSGNLPDNTFCQLSKNVFVLSAEGCYARLAPKLAVPRHVVLAMELCGSYVFSPVSARYEFGVASATTIARLAKYCSSLPHSRGTKLGLSMDSLRWAVQNSASIMETIVVALLVLPYRYGGYGIKLPVMNVALDAGGNIVAPATRGCRKPDIAWLEHGLALEYNGKESHSGIDDYERDSDRRDELEAMGLRVIPISSGKLYDVERFHQLACEVARLTGKKLQLPRGFESRRENLRREILPRRSAARRLRSNPSAI